MSGLAIVLFVATAAALGLIVGAINRLKARVASLETDVADLLGDNAAGDE